MGDGAEIITFYSYKGGAGRSMHLANVAWILAGNGKRVLAVDWDLEAPGLHRYFHPFLIDKELIATDGLIDMVWDFADAAMTPVAEEDRCPGWHESYADISRYITALSYEFPGEGQLDLLSAGRQGTDYARRVNLFNWQNFYERIGGGAFLEAAKKWMRAEYDYVLIDSRTGVSDTAGICTVQMPDTLVIMFTANNQNIEGSASVAQSVLEQWATDPRHVGEQRIFPVLTRVDTAEKDKLAARKALARAKFNQYLTSIEHQAVNDYWRDIEVPYIPWYSYEEVIAAFADRFKEKASILESAESLTRFLTRGAVMEAAPSSETDRKRILTQFTASVVREALAPEVPIDESPACPYPGLGRFTAANRDLLFGRERDKDAILQRIRGRHTRILVVGPSGSGKSSLIHAAVLPELTPGDHVVQAVSRGGDTTAALRMTIGELEVPVLSAALDQYLGVARGATGDQIEQARTQLRTVQVPDARRRVVVLDPFEEIFFNDDIVGRETLLCLLDGLWSLPWCTVILCMRADFYGVLMVERCWHELEGSQYHVAPLDETGLRAAIIEPARRVGVHVDAALVERLIREIDRDRSSVPLPLLQVALKELWVHLRGRSLTLADYEHIVNNDGRGLAAVLAVHAEGVMQKLIGPGDRAVAQRILLDLVHLGEGRPHTRRRRTLDELQRSNDAPGQLERVLETLIQERLVTTSDNDPTATRGEARQVGPVHGAGSSSSDDMAVGAMSRHVDLAHDVLITGWPALAGWIAAHRDDLRTQRRLEARAASGGLLASSELPEFTRWVEWISTPAGQTLGASEVLRTLVRRSVAARRRRRGALGIGLVMMMSLGVVFGFQTMQLRKEKTKTQRSINQATEAAELIVFDVNTKLQTLAGASSVRETLLERSNALLVELRKLGDQGEREQRTAWASKMAQADFALERGHLEEARALQLEALTDTQRRATADPTNREWQSDLSLSYRKLGETAVAAGKLDDARAWFDKALAISTALVAADSTNPGWQSDLSVSYDRLGDVAVTAGKLGDARAWFDKALAVGKALVAADPTNPSWQSNLSITYGKLGDVAMTVGKLDDARAWFEEALAVNKSLAAADPANAGWQRSLSISYRKLGDIAVTVGKLDDARAWYDQALAVAKVLAAADPANTRWQSDLSISYDRVGEVAMTAGQLEDARAWFDKALAVNKSLAAADPTNTDWQRSLSTLYGKLGDVAEAMGKLEDARAWFDKALAVAKVLAAADPANTRWQNDLSVLYKRLGNVAAEGGNYNDARTWFDKALAVAKVLADKDPTNADWQSDLSVLYKRLGIVAAESGNYNDARTWFDKALAAAKVLADKDPTNAAWRRELWIIYMNLGDIGATLGKLEDARAWFDKALAVAKNLTAVDPANTSWQRDLCLSLAAIVPVTRNRNEASRYLTEAHAIYGQLQKGGFFQHDNQFVQLGTKLDQLTARIGTVPPP